MPPNSLSQGLNTLLMKSAFKGSPKGGLKKFGVPDSKLAGCSEPCSVSQGEMFLLREGLFPPYSPWYHKQWAQFAWSPGLISKKKAAQRFPWWFNG